jgi:hypothetical protein
MENNPKTRQEPGLSQGVPSYQPPKAIMRITYKEIVRAILYDAGAWGEGEDETTIPDEFPIFFDDGNRTIFISDTLGARDVEDSGMKQIGTWKDIRTRLEREPGIRKLLDKTRSEDDRKYAESRQKLEQRMEETRKRDLIRDAAPDLYDAVVLILKAVDITRIQRGLIGSEVEALKIGIQAARAAYLKANGEEVFTLSTRNAIKYVVNRVIAPETPEEVPGKQVPLGTFDTLQDARSLAESAARSRYQDQWEWINDYQIASPDAVVGQHVYFVIHAE